MLFMRNQLKKSKQPPFAGEANAAYPFAVMFLAFLQWLGFGIFFPQQHSTIIKISIGALTAALVGTSFLTA